MHECGQAAGELLPGFVHKCDCRSRHGGPCLPPAGQHNTVVYQRFLSSSHPFSSSPAGIKNAVNPK